jgi:serine/threonine-protein kinase
MGDLIGEKELFEGRFKLERLIGTGAMGSVYEAIDLNNNMRCALKLIEKERAINFPEYISYLSRIKSSLLNIPIPNLLLPLEIGETKVYLYESYEYLDSVESLRSVIDSNTYIQPFTILTIISKIAQTLIALHDRSIIHSDIKPSNILINRDISPDVYLIDLGMAMPFESDGSMLIIGTYLYMHPELKRNLYQLESFATRMVSYEKNQIGTYIDIYALGVVTMELLTGSAEIPHPLSESRIEVTLWKNNTWFRDLAGC